MPELLLLRHGIAADADGDQGLDPQLADAARPLTAAGRRRTAAVLQRLLGLNLCCDRLFSSPLLRARQTAELALQAGLAPTLSEVAALAPGGEAAGWLRGVVAGAGSEPDRQRWALVGHEPDLSSLGAALIGADAGSLQLRKAGVALLSWDHSSGQSRLLLLLTPRVLLDL